MLTPRPGIMKISPYVGGESALDGQQRIIKLSSNEGALGPSPKAMAAYTAEAANLHRYPDGGANRLRDAIGAHFGLDAEQIVCGNGSDELISMLCRAYAGPDDEILYSEHGFLMYPISAHTVGATPVSAPETDLTANVDALLAAVTDRTRIVFLANPNNPTGTYLPKDEVARLRAGLPDRTLLVIDAAYAEFVSRNDYDPGNELVDACDNVVMTRTFSKVFGLGALRLGWAYGPPHIMDVLNRLRGPFNTTAAAQAAGVAALEDTDFLERSLQHNETTRSWFMSQIDGMSGVTAVPSRGNFVLVRFRDQTTAEGADMALKSSGIIVRRMGGYGLPDSLRISIGQTDEMEICVSALRQYIESTG